MLAMSFKTGDMCLRKPLCALALMLLEPDEYYHERMPGEAIDHDAEWKNELMVAQCALFASKLLAYLAIRRTRAC
ncbi:hypothetical protein SERLA73DRAFT_182416 [Serpula lacrymans var. lacrymans S7.3]|uniref:Uncharacterized protein n=2 Tax=Serpula lacrymans var. lacrymans TaxID=341189 RepID=F8PXE2_SERL3|nr:uncharacterized protein SERLADRAFT_469065 [Serpula lacrymans var. lacrymans S7.9]EGN99468.1 hypothetical protein SERLA73DRAFT_182416 [Serpula lacrymans var. lacrymans S7.3]EGO25023.1 hypothetical protein SERLADRAFT_469065 [Serpula lacrymans var. lacrymans S7.9]